MKFTDGVLRDTSVLPDGRGVSDFGEAVDLSSEQRCFGPYGCEGVYIFWDHKLAAKRYVYMKNEVQIIATEAAFLADKAAGFP